MLRHLCRKCSIVRISGMGKVGIDCVVVEPYAVRKVVLANGIKSRVIDSCSGKWSDPFRHTADDLFWRYAFQLIFPARSYGLSFYSDNFLSILSLTFFLSHKLFRISFYGWSANIMCIQSVRSYIVHRHYVLKRGETCLFCFVLLSLQHLYYFATKRTDFHYIFI